MEYIFGIIIFLFGAALGSFVAVIADRYNTGLSIFKSRSFCFSCGTQLTKQDLVPILSFLFLKGKCRHCQSKIPLNTIMVEIVMGLLSILAAFKSGLLISDFSILHDSYFIIQNNFSLLLATSYWLLLTAIFAVIFLISIYDLKHFIIPDSFLVSFFILSVLYLSIPALLAGGPTLSAGGPVLPIGRFQPFTLQSLISSIALPLPFLFLFLVSKGKWLGFGDVKYILVLGFFLGLTQGLSAIALSVWIGAVVSLTIIFLNHFKIHLPTVRNNFTIKSEIPFGPFLSLGAVISFWFDLDLFQLNALFF